MSHTNSLNSSLGERSTGHNIFSAGNNIENLKQLSWQLHALTQFTTEQYLK
jgi:hypothetical protein